MDVAVLPTIVSILGGCRAFGPDAGVAGSRYIEVMTMWGIL